MNLTSKINKLAITVGVLVGSQSALALPPTTPLPGSQHTIFLAGGAAQDPSLDQLIKDNLALPGTFDVYYDNGNPNGARHRAYFFTTDSSKIPGLSGTVNVLIYKRSNGGAGYGVIPLIQDPPPPVRQLDFTAANSTTFDAVNQRYVVSATQSNRFADAGITGVNPQLLSGNNYPQPTSSAVGDTFSTTEVVGAQVAQRLNVVPSGGLAFGLAVTLDLYKVLQAAQKYSGTLPADTPLGAYNKPEYIPTLPRQFAASLLAGSLRFWDQVVVYNSAGVGRTLPQIAAGIVGVPNGISSLPFRVSTRVPVSIGNRNKGAAIQSAFSIKLLGYGTVPGAFAPASAPSLVNVNATPYVTQAPGASQQEQVLLDWQNGTNIGGLNPPSTVGGASPKRWGVAQQSTDWNASYAKDYRYVRIDGYTPTLDNIFIGGYPLWTEQTLQWRKSYTGATTTFQGLVPTGDKLLILQRLAAVIGSPTAAAAVNAKLNSVIGPTGLFGVSTDSSVPNSSITGVFNPNNPIIPYTHVNTGGLNNGVPPILNRAKVNTVKLP